MTDRLDTLTVALETDMREDDAQALISAIQQLRGVLKVEGNVTDPAAWLSYARVRRELTDKLWGALKPTERKP
jgi:hypothetical protein